MTHAFDSLVATPPLRKAMTSGAPHSKGTKKASPRPPKKQVGTIQISLRAGSVIHVPANPLLPPYVDACAPPANGTAQTYRLTLSLIGGRFVKRQKMSTGDHVFTDLPIGRYRVDVENISPLPAYPDAIAEVLVKRGKNPQLCVIHSTDTLGALGDACQFRVGSLGNNAPLAGAQRAELNEVAVGSFWASFWVGQVTVPAGQNAVVLSGASVPTDPNAAGNVAVVDAATKRRIHYDHGDLVGVMTDTADSPPKKLLSFFGYDAAHNLQPVDPAFIGGKTLRFRPQAPRPDYPTVSYTPVVWRASSGTPWDWNTNPKKGPALMRAIEDHVEETLSLLPLNANDQCVVVNESLNANVTWDEVLGKKGKKGAVRFQGGAVKKNPRKLLKWMATHKKDREAFFERCLTQNEVGGWLGSLHDRGPKYIERSFERAYEARKDVRHLLNDFGIEDLARPKSVAFLILAEHLKKTLPGGAAGQLGAAFQMHLTPSSAPFEPKAKWRAFLTGLAGVMRELGRLHLPVYITEMAARMEGLDSFQMKRRRADLRQALIRASAGLPGVTEQSKALIAAMDPSGKHGTVADLVTTFDQWTARRAKAAVKKKTDEEQKQADEVARKKHERPEKVVLSAAEIADVEDSLYSSLLKKFPPGTEQYANPRQWQGAPFTYAPDPVYAQEVPFPKPKPKSKKRQKEIFRDIVQLCLSRHNCNDMNFWGSLDDPRSDDPNDLLGHLFSQVPGAPTSSSPSWFRKPAFFGALMGVIEAAVAKGRLHDYARSQHRTHSTFLKKGP